MYLYIGLWIAASSIVMFLGLYRRSLERNGMARAFGNLDFDVEHYEAAFRRRLNWIDRSVRAVGVAFPSVVFMHLTVHYGWHLLHSSATWQTIRVAVER
jgi:hypothetical protein